MLYVRAEKRDGYIIITEIDESGNYRQRCETKGKRGEKVIFNKYETTVFLMGWSSVKDLIIARKGFEKVYTFDEIAEAKNDLELLAIDEDQKEYSAKYSAEHQSIFFCIPSSIKIIGYKKKTR